MRKSSPSLIVLAVAGLALAVGAGIEAYGEVRPFVFAWSTTTEKQRLLTAGEVRPGQSLVTATAILNDCLALARSPLLAIQGGEAQEPVFQECGRVATELGENAPLNAHAWLVAAEMAARLGDADAFNVRLARSRSSAPHVQWLASARLDLVERFFAATDQANQSGEIADIGTLLESSLGIAELARHYVMFETARERITTVVERHSNTIQTRFLGAVVAATKEANG